MIKRDPKKPGDPGTYIRKYANIGFVDAASSATLQHPIGGVSAFSVTSHAQEMQRRSSQLRIARLRTNFGGLIGASA